MKCDAVRFLEQSWRGANLEQAPAVPSIMPNANLHVGRIAVRCSEALLAVFFSWSDEAYLVAIDHLRLPQTPLRHSS